MKFLALLFIFLHVLSASVLVTKRLGPAVVNKNTTVTIAILNKGPELATDITVHDQTFNNASAFKIVSGKNYQKVPDLKVNQTYKVVFVVSPKLAGSTKSFPAVVKYNTPEKKGLTAFSTYHAVYVAQYDQVTALFYQGLQFVTAFGVLFGLYAWYVKSKSKEKKK